MKVSVLSLGLCLMSLSLGLFAQTAPASLSLEEALASGLAADPGYRSAMLEATAARFREKAGKLKLLPSLALSAGYTQLSPEPGLSFSGLSSSELQSLAPYLSTLESLEPALAQLLAGVDHSADLRLDFQYPLLTVFSQEKNAETLDYLARGREAAVSLSRQNLVFSIQKAYWEAKRADAGQKALREASDLETELLTETGKLHAQGMASDAEVLASEARSDQSALALREAQDTRELAYLYLASLIGSELSPGESPTFILSTEARDQPSEASSDQSKTTASDTDFSSSDSSASARNLSLLLDKALEQRPEIRQAALDIRAKEAAKSGQELSMLPNLLLKASLSYADPDPRIFPAQDVFNLSWAIGLRLSYDLGTAPSTAAEAQAADAELGQAKAAVEKAEQAVTLDVQRSDLALNRAISALKLTQDIAAQAAEGLRVTEQKYKLGLSKYSELLEARLASLKARTDIEFRLFDLEIARADLHRALGE